MSAQANRRRVRLRRPCRPLPPAAVRGFGGAVSLRATAEYPAHPPQEREVPGDVPGTDDRSARYDDTDPDEPRQDDEHDADLAVDLLVRHDRRGEEHLAEEPQARKTDSGEEGRRQHLVPGELSQQERPSPHPEERHQDQECQDRVADLTEGAAGQRVPEEHLDGPTSEAAGRARSPGRRSRAGPRTAGPRSPGRWPRERRTGRSPRSRARRSP